MMANALKDALGKSGGKLAGSTAKPAPAPAPEPQADMWTPRTTSSRQASRDGMLAITVHYPPEVRRQLKTLAAEQDRTMDDMVAEALNLLFVRYGKAEIAPRKAGK